MVTAHRWWNRHKTTNEGVATMGTEWGGRTPIVSNGGQPRISPSETALERANQKVDAALAEGAALDEAERSRKLTAERERLWRVAYTEVEQRAYALHELAGISEDQQVEELRTLQVLITTALGRYQVMVSGRRNGTGLYQQTARRPLPAYRQDGAQ